MTSSAVFPRGRATAASSSPLAGRWRDARLWRGAMGLSAAAGAGLLLAVFAAVPARTLLALALVAAGGALGVAWPARNARGAAVRLWLDGATSALALGLAGGVSGPLSPLALLPILAAIAYGGLWRQALAPAVAAVVAVALVQAGGGLAAGPEPQLALGLSLVALLLALAGAAGALLLRSAPEPAAAAHPVEATPATEPDAGRAELERRLELAQAAQAAAEADARGKMRFLANMSHELRTPLNAIMGFSDIMRTRLFGELQPRYAEYAELIHESGGHLLDLINDVLDVSKIDADRYQLAREVFDAREAVTAALRILRQQADDAGVQLRGQLPGAAIEVDADRRALKQIVLNLVSNALKFTPAGGSVSVSLAAVAQGLEIAVADTGVGIAPEDLDRLGRPYEQAGDAHDRMRGTGLGLSLVRAFARLHGGDMVLESRLGEGTAVTVRLPVLTQPNG